MPPLPETPAEPVTEAVKATTAYNYVHPACQSVAFTLFAQPVLGQSILGMRRVVGGEEQSGGAHIECQHCGAKLTQFAARHVKEA